MEFNNVELLIENQKIKVTSMEIANILQQENKRVNRKIEEEWDYCTIVQKWSIDKLEYDHKLKDGGIVKRTYYTMDSDMGLFIISRFNNKNAKDAMCKIIKALREAQEFILQEELLEEFNFFRQGGKVQRHHLTEMIDRYLGEVQYARQEITNLIYKNLFGKTAKEIREEKGINREELTRDYFNPEELARIKKAEFFVATVIFIKNNEGKRPFEIIDAIQFQLNNVEIIP